MNKQDKQNEKQIRENYARALLVEKLLNGDTKVKEQMISSLQFAGVHGLHSGTRVSSVILAIKKLEPLGLHQMISSSGLLEKVTKSDISTMSSTLQNVDKELSEREMPTLNLSAIEHIQDQNSSIRGSIKNTEQTKSRNMQTAEQVQSILDQHTEETKSHHHQAVGIIQSIVSDETILKKVPYLKTIKKLEDQGKITREQANIERAETISVSTLSNKSTFAFVEEAIRGRVMETARRYKQDIAKLQAIHDRKGYYTYDENGRVQGFYLKKPLSQLKNLGQSGFTDPDVDQTRIVGQKFRPEEEVKNNREFNNQVIGDSSTISNQTGVLNEMPSQKRIGPDFSKFAQEKSHLVDDFTAKLIAIKQNKSQNVKLNESVTRILQKIEKAKLGAIQAEADLKHPDKGPDNSGTSETVIDDTSSLDPFPKGGKDIPRGIEDIIQTNAWKKLVTDKISEKTMTTDQVKYTERVLYDPDGLIDLLSSSSGSSSSGSSSSISSSSINSSSKGSRMPRSSKWSRQAYSDLYSEIMREVQNNNGNYGQLDNLKLVDKDGKPISLSDVINMIPKVVDTVAKIQGDIDLTKKLSDYKKQTEVFGTKIVKKETNKFAVAQGSAFRLRACC